MPTENERGDIQKAMARGLLRMFGQNPGKACAAEELEQLIGASIVDAQR